VVRLPAAAGYRPSHFYERELPVLLALLAVIHGRLPLFIRQRCKQEIAEYH